MNSIDTQALSTLLALFLAKAVLVESFVTGILATNLARAGKRVGILDGGITGPSRMFGISDELLRH